MDELIILVQSMDWAEKRYFRKYARRHQVGKENQYLKLFSELENASPDRTTNALPNRTAALRSYLQKLILRSLREYHHQSSAEMELRCLLDYLDLIEDRWLPKLQLRMIRKGIERARSAGLPQYELDFLRHLRKHIRSERRPEQADSLGELAQQELDSLQNLREEIFWLQHYDQVYLQAQAYTESGSAAEDGPAQASPPCSFNGSLAFFTSRAIHAIQRSDYRQSQHYFARNLEVWHSFPVQIRDHHRRYISAVMNYLSACHRTEDHHEFARVLGEVKLNQHLGRRTQQVLNLKIHDLALILNMQTLNVEGAMEASVQLASILSTEKFDEILELSVSWNLAMFYFSLDLHSDSLKWINRVLNRPRSQSRVDLILSAQIMEIVLHFELGNTEYVMGRLRSLERMRRRITLPAWSWELFLCLRKVIRLRTRTAQKAVFAKLHSQLRDLEETQQIAGFFELNHWLLHRIANQPTIEVMRQQK